MVPVGYLLPLWQERAQLAARRPPQSEAREHKTSTVCHMVWSAVRSCLCRKGDGDNSAPQNMEVVDAFCGAGGFSAGAMAAGCRVTTSAGV